MYVCMFVCAISCFCIQAYAYEPVTRAVGMSVGEILIMALPDGDDKGCAGTSTILKPGRHVTRRDEYLMAP